MNFCPVPWEGGQKQEAERNQQKRKGRDGSDCKRGKGRLRTLPSLWFEEEVHPAFGDLASLTLLPRDFFLTVTGGNQAGWVLFPTEVSVPCTHVMLRAACCLIHIGKQKKWWKKGEREKEMKYRERKCKLERFLHQIPAPQEKDQGSALPLVGF